jgi:hypothetical protein
MAPPALLHMTTAATPTVTPTVTATALPFVRAAVATTATATAPPSATDTGLPFARVVADWVPLSPPVRVAGFAPLSGFFPGTLIAVSLAAARGGVRMKVESFRKGVVSYISAGRPGTILGHTQDPPLVGTGRENFGIAAKVQSGVAQEFARSQRVARNNDLCLDRRAGIDAWHRPTSSPAANLGAPVHGLCTTLSCPDLIQLQPASPYLKPGSESVPNARVRFIRPQKQPFPAGLEIERVETRSVPVATRFRRGIPYGTAWSLRRTPPKSLNTGNSLRSTACSHPRGKPEDQRAVSS